MNLVTLLKEKGVITDAVATQVEQQMIEKEVNQETALLGAGVELEVMRTTLGAYYDLPTAAIEENEVIDPQVVKYVPQESASHYRMIPLRLDEEVLVVGVTDPEAFGLRDALNFITTKYQMPYRLAVILERDFKNGLRSYENLSGEVDTALGELKVELDEQEHAPQDTQQQDQKAVIEELKEDAPVTKIVATVLRYAVDGGASDIHIEPYDQRVVVRFRVDGTLVRSLELPKKVQTAVVARVKILSSLRLDEKRKPQDGRFSAVIDDRKIDFRVSILPTNSGEKVVMRILDTEQGVHRLEDTGLSQHNIDIVRHAIKQPYGIVLISGPTGSGKSTTLYAMLSEVDREGKNVLSLEDPVEYNIEGVSQSQVRPEIGYTFATGLRTALRQDPDVIMVGEIRDRETAQLAIQAALTGHLVLSTLHTNNALGVVPRLVDMGIDPYLIAPTLRLALAQRLVRRICPNTGVPVPLEGSTKRIIDEEFKDFDPKLQTLIPKVDHVLRAEPSADCASGTKGRVAIMEAIEVNDEIERLILEGAPEEKLYAAARKNGYISMKEDAIIKAMEHTIPFEEVNSLGGVLFATDDMVAADELPPVTPAPQTTPATTTEPVVERAPLSEAELEAGPAEAQSDIPTA